MLWKIQKKVKVTNWKETAKGRRTGRDLAGKAKTRQMMMMVIILCNAFAIFVNLCGANLQNENNLNFEVLTVFTMKISIAIIITPGTKTEICNFFQDKRRPKRR